MTSKKCHFIQKSVFEFIFALNSYGNSKIRVFGANAKKIRFFRQFSTFYNRQIRQFYANGIIKILKLKILKLFLKVKNSHLKFFDSKIAKHRFWFFFSQSILGTSAVCNTISFLPIFGLPVRKSVHVGFRTCWFRICHPFYDMDHRYGFVNDMVDVDDMDLWTQIAEIYPV